MRKPWFFGAALVLAACTGAPEAARSEAPQPPAAGGYQPTQRNDDIINAAERLAVAEIYQRDPQRGILEKVTREQQVVAGMNYRFTIKMTGLNAYRIVVFKPLEGEMTVTAFEKLTGD